MGDCDNSFLELFESLVKYHPATIKILTLTLSGYGTVCGGQFDWGGRLPKGNGGVQRFAQAGRKSVVECKGISELNCETNTSNKDESRP